MSKQRVGKPYTEIRRSKFDLLRRFLGGRPAGRSACIRVMPGLSHVLEEGGNGFVILPEADHQAGKDLASPGGEAPGRRHRFTPLARPDPLGDAVDEQVGDVLLALGEPEAVLSQPFPDLRHRGAGKEK